MPLLAAAPEKVAVVVSTTRYVHSKTWVIDDEFAIVGSANCNRRGYTHDSEASVGVYAVSYTHLDVYKRQASRCGTVAGSALRATSVESRSCGTKTTGMTSGWTGIQAVSYTHLDVYKRQV